MTSIDRNLVGRIQLRYKIPSSIQLEHEPNCLRRIHDVMDIRFLIFHIRMNRKNMIMRNVLFIARSVDILDIKSCNVICTCDQCIFIRNAVGHVVHDDVCLTHVLGRFDKETQPSFSNTIQNVRILVHRNRVHLIHVDVLDIPCRSNRLNRRSCFTLVLNQDVIIQ